VLFTFQVLSCPSGSQLNKWSSSVKRLNCLRTLAHDGISCYSNNIVTTSFFKELGYGSIGFCQLYRMEDMIGTSYPMFGSSFPSSTACVCCLKYTEHILMYRQSLYLSCSQLLLVVSGKHWRQTRGMCHTKSKLSRRKEVREPVCSHQTY
jgi:hypothetical protein